MCGRFNATDSPEVRALLKDLNIDIGPIPVRYNIAPTDPVMVIYHAGDSYAARDMRWWLTPSWSDGPSQKFSMFNARMENIATSRAFRAPFKRRRAIVPGTSFIEWQTTAKGKQPYLIAPAAGPLLFAGVWDCWSDGQGSEIFSCAIITTRATAQFARIHNRQPVMLAPHEAKAWLDAAQDVTALETLMEPHLPAPMVITPVSANINNARHKIAPQRAGESFVLACE